MHLLSRPWQLFLDDTFFLLDVKKPALQMGLAVSPGGKVSREGFIWMSIFPFLSLTILPFILLFTSYWTFSPMFILLACANIGFSSLDLFNAYRVWSGMGYQEILIQKKSCRE